jgi:hypothetical protein
MLPLNDCKPPTESLPRRRRNALMSSGHHGHRPPIHCHSGLFKICCIRSSSVTANVLYTVA